MPIYNVKLKNREEVAENTMAFTFEKPEGFTFKSGQWCDFILDNPTETDAEGNTRESSLANPPYVKDILVATRMRNRTFKRVLKNLPIGIVLKFEAQSGSFTLHNNTSIPAVSLTGGIGITPVRSIVMQAAKDKLPHTTFLFYSNHRPEDAAFLKELKSIENEHQNYRFIATMTDMSKSNIEKDGEAGYITKDMLKKYVNDLLKPIYYISGPAAMVAAMRKMLN